MLWSRLSRALRDQAANAGADFRFGTEVSEVTTSGAGVRVVLGDGDVLEGDFLVGADGTRSRVRTLIDPAAPSPQGGSTRTLYGYTSQPQCAPPPPEVLRLYLGSRAFFAARYEIRAGGCTWFTNIPAAAAPQDATTDGLRAYLLDLFADDTSPAVSLVEHADRILGFDDLALPHVPCWHTDRMIIIGDALHVAPPASEQGAAMAIEDGVVLAQCVRDLATPAEAFAAFDRLRRERVEAVVALGLRGTTRARDRGVQRIVRQVRERAGALTAWQRRPATGGPAWAYDHHISWDQLVTET